MSTAARLFCKESVRHLCEEYVPRLGKAVEALPEDDLWWRPHAGCTSVGNILLHLEGNVRQWILSGLGGLPDHRHRAAEFAAERGETKERLMESLRACVTEACAIIGSLDEDALLSTRPVQSFRTTGLGAVYHVVEHFGWHVGQAVWIAKMRSGEEHGIAFYDDASLNEARNP